ncbi:MAG: hypothetical protein QOK30_1136 [Nocardioidaceae bacterium]|jgi:hypothetical protein|nr:hypothetical protein [Nocardioidaceae bacterium]
MSGQSLALQARLFGVANTALGAVLLARPEAVADAAAGSIPPRPGWVRLLGARYLVQGAAQASMPRAAVLQLSVVVDALHAASMVGLAMLRAEYRRPALISAAVATGSAAVTWAQARRLHQTDS